MPTPLEDTIVAMTLARAIMVATKLGIFEVLAKQACTTHDAGTWSMQEIAQWQREAGLLPRKPIRLLTAPGSGLQGALKPNFKG